MLHVDPHPLLELRALRVTFLDSLAALGAAGGLVELLKPGASTPLTPPDEAVRGAVRDLLRHGGYKPTGRGKPASEYLAKAAEEGKLGSINVAVDAGNAASLHSGLPISVVDLARAQAPLRVGIAPPGSRYVFNLSGQEIDVGGLLCLLDATGPCANAVKDAQRTKTDGETRSVLVLVWGATALGDRTERTARWLGELLTQAGGQVAPGA